MPYSQPLDIGARACQIVGARRITSWTDGSQQANEIAFNYDKLRTAELKAALWTRMTRRTVLRAIGIDTVLWTPPVWAAGAYAAGAIVSYTPTTGPYKGFVGYWQLSTAEANSIVSPDNDPLWDHYTGPVAIDLFNTAGGAASNAANNAYDYQAGEVVLVPAQWVASTAYLVNTVVAYDNNGTWQWYVSLCDLTSYTAPPSDTANWVLWASTGRGTGTYGVTTAGSPVPLVYPSNSTFYLSLYNDNADNPLNDCGVWLLLGGTFAPLSIVWPLNAGPLGDLRTLNAFYRPNGFLHQAPSDPRGGQNTWLGAASGVMPDDWVVEGPLIVSSDSGPIMLRFIADITDVTKFPSEFCEALAARIATECVELLTQARDKKIDTERVYARALRMARLANAIEVGPVSPVENRYVTVRL